MFGSGSGRDCIKSLVLIIIASKSDNELDGGLYMYTRIIIRSGLCIFTMNKSHTALEYFRQIVWIRLFIKYRHTPPPGLVTLSLTIMKPGMCTSLSSIPSHYTIHHTIQHTVYHDTYYTIPYHALFYTPCCRRCHTVYHDL